MSSQLNCGRQRGEVDFEICIWTMSSDDSIDVK